MSFATVDALREALSGATKQDVTPEYAAKMLHDLPQADVVDRARFFIEQCRGKRVLEFGSSGVLSDALRQVASAYAGVDREASAGVIAWDLDDVYVDGLPIDEPACEIVVCGEVLEHLGNPGHFLARIKRQYVDVPVLISVPNAFSSISQGHVKKGRENVNLDHVAWYSPRTLRTLLERYGYTISEWHWYNGEPGTAEGLIVVAR